MELLQHCQATKRLYENPNVMTSSEFNFNAHCIGYLEGYTSGIRVPEKTPSFCVPHDSTMGQIALVFVEWANRHPEMLHEAASYCVVVALVESFPCPAKSKRE